MAAPAPQAGSSWVADRIAEGVLAFEGNIHVDGVDDSITLLGDRDVIAMSLAGAIRRACTTDDADVSGRFRITVEPLDWCGRWL